MPLYELYRLAREKLGRENNSTRASDQCSSPENDFFELVWENGQISSQGQASRVRTSPSCRSLPSHCLPSHSPKGREKDVGYGANRMGKSRDLDSGLNEISMSVPSREVDFCQDEDVLPWFDYTMDGSLQHDYGSDFLPASTSFTVLDKKSNGNMALRDSHKTSVEQGNVFKASSAEQVETAGPKASTSQLYPPSLHHCQVSSRSRASDITENNNTSNANQDASYGEITRFLSSSSDFCSSKGQTQDPPMPGNGSSSTIMNFSHFARPAAMVRANLQNIGLKSGLASARSDSIEIKNKGAAATSSIRPESILVDSTGECSKELTMHCQQVVDQSKTDLNSLPQKSVQQNGVPSKQSEPACKESSTKIDQIPDQVLGDSCAKGQTTTEKSMEPAVASSSVCSGNGADRVSDEPNQNLKRKRKDTDESECHSETFYMKDVEEESAGVKKAPGGRGGAGSKRTRAAEVHNLSERRRRDRINEKMRALQELIPNCNKVDKASMLDEAIEYLKTLQLQVQIMSMGAGLYMPPMMLPAGMQHMHAPHMAPFSPMGVGMHMGYGMGYGMGMPDMNGGPSRIPMIQVPQMQGSHIPAAHMSAPTAFHGMVRSNLPGFGLPGQGHPMPMPRAPAFPFSGGPIMNSPALGLHACGSSGLVETVDSASASGLKNQMPNVDPQVKQNTGGPDSTSQMPTQSEAAVVGFEQSALVPSGVRTSEANDKVAVNSGPSR